MKYKKLIKIYENLLKKHNYQGWWPINGKYAPKNYEIPLNEEQKFEISIGAILTQNTSWKNVEKTLLQLKNKNLLSPEKIILLSNEELAQIIKSSGYHNQKAKKLKKFSEFILKKENQISRDSLLKIWGIGKETADTILLYVYKQPFFVVDTYTKRLFSQLLNINFKTYSEWQNFFHENLPKNYKMFNEFHALIVAEGKLKQSYPNRHFPFAV